MRMLFRIATVPATFVATFFFTCSLPFSLLMPGRHSGSIPFIVSLLWAVGAGIPAWRGTARAADGLVRSVLLCCLLLLGAPLTPHAHAQQRERIYGKNRVLKSNEYFLRQMDLWKQRVDSLPSDADAWYNYYRANRNAYVTGEESDSLAAKGVGRFQRLQTIVDGMARHVPESYEYHFVAWLNGNGDPALFPHLDAAHRLAPDRSEPLQALAYWYETAGDSLRRDEALAGWYRSGDCSPGLLTYAYNMFAGMEPGALVFTEGDKDTDMLLVLQGAKGLRTDVRVLNVNLLLREDYRARVFRALGVADLGFDPLRDEAALERYKREIIAHCARNVAGRPVHVAVSVSDPYTDPITARLHLVGLTRRYAVEPFDPAPLLTRGFEEWWHLDQLRDYLPYDISEGNLRQFNQNYLPALAALESLYRAASNESRANACLTLARKIAADAGTDAVYRRCFGSR